eukprot:gene14602-19325_t
MSLADDVDLEVFVMSKDELSGADIKAVSVLYIDIDEIFLVDFHAALSESQQTGLR